MMARAQWITGVSLLACSAMGTRPIMVDPGILPEISSRESTWSLARSPIAFSAGRASNRASYDRLKATGIIEDVTNQQVKSEYLICDVLGSVTKDARLKPMAQGMGYGEALASRLDLRSFPSSLGPRLDDERYTLRRLIDANQLKMEPWGLTYDSPDWSYVLRVVLVGDIDRSGAIDWVIWLTDEALDGNYRGYDTLLVRDVARDGLLQAQPL